MTTLTKGSRLTGPARDRLTADIIKKYARGLSIREIAEQSGRSYGNVHKLLSEAGVTLRGRGGATKRK